MNDLRQPPIKLAGIVLLVIAALVFTFIYLQFRGTLTPKTKLTMISSRAGLVMDPGAKVTYNGVEIGRVADVVSISRDGKQMAQLNLEVKPRYVPLIPSNVDASIKASTVFGNKYVSFTSPKNPTKARISPSDVIDASGVTTEFNTLFETLTNISEKVDPVKLNLTLSAAAEALSGLGSKFGQAIVNGNSVLDQLNPLMPQLQKDTRSLSALADVYVKASPDFWGALDNAVTTASTLNDRRGDLDAALLAAAGVGNTAGDVFERGEPYFVRGQADLIPTAQVLDKYSPQFYCQLRNEAEALQLANASFGGNGYSLDTVTEFLGAPNPYIYPDNLPRVNAKGGPGGAPGCWQRIDRNFWPAPYLVMDNGASLAPYNHFELGQPILNEYVWGRQIGEYTINP